MEQATGIKYKLTGLLESALAKRGTVLYILRHYAGMYEVRVHLPDTKMENWNKPQHIKCKVAAGRYRDYTPAVWDPITKSCSLFIDTSHEGPGSEWARSLRSGDPLTYLGIDSYGKAPVDTAEQVYFGDPSAIGHFFALMQLTNGPGKISGSIIVQHEQHREAFEASFPSLSIDTVCSTEALAASSPLIYDAPDKQFYLAGNSMMVHSLRKLLKQQGVAAHKVHAQGFWK
ncbi:SIP domain-containing protein [Pseudoflavitalea rhizosphaerae]|uniref:SIP domain-containing protein n=1 Tax=Pseudoflavitalea rhizosphaerae TaxID=1884793 RepID=UPI000F8E3691|nr:SIP domain-containing protein [Pseudoflavitalea rhizosphaerae]